MTLGHLPLVTILSAAVSVTTFVLGFGLVIPMSGAVGGLADLIGVASTIVVLGLLVPSLGPKAHLRSLRLAHERL